MNGVLGYTILYFHASGPERVKSRDSTPGRDVLTVLRDAVALNDEDPVLVAENTIELGTKYVAFRPAADASLAVTVRLLAGKADKEIAAIFGNCCPTKTKVFDSVTVTLRQHAVQ